MSIPKRKVRRVEFGVMSPDQIESYGVCEITEPTTVKGKEGGLYDLRMGPTSHGDLCKTCGQNMDTCPGHFGYIKLNARVVHYGFIEYIYKVLQIVCWNCRKLLARPSAKDLEEEKPSALERAAQLERLKRTRKGPLRLGALKMLQSKTCPHCGEVVSSFKRTEGVRFERFFKENMDGYNAADVEEAGAGGRRSRGQQQQQQQRMQDKKEMLTGDKIWNVFKDLSREDVELMGFDWERSHPKNMLISVFPVSPPAVRPSVDNGGQSASNDDLTNILKKVIIINNDIAEKNVGQEKQQSIDTLTAYITAYINNDLPSKRPLTSTSGRPYKAISQRLKGKEGRVRGNLMGKRVDFSGRTVITPDPNLDIDEVGVPVSIAITLTVPEYVNALNIRKLERLIEAGPDKYPGAKSVTIVGLDGSETKYSLKTGRDFRAKIEPGRAIVERHLMTGDIVVFNRQPSLHKMSMMGHRARVMPFSSFRLNLCVTTPYNADFDGDEMNLHVPQDLAARAEVRELMMVPKNIVAPASNRPVMGIVQDSLLGSMLMTQPSTFVDKDSVFNTLSWLNEWDWKVPYPAIIKAPGKPTITSSGTGTGGSSRSSGLSISNSGVNGDNNSDDDDDDNNNNNGDDDYNNSDTEAAAAMDIEGDGGNGMLRRRRRRRTTRRGAGAGAGTGKGGPLWTGKQLFSKVMPDISLTRGDLGGDIRKGRDKGFKFQENTVVISHGELLCGVIKKNLIGPSSSGGITHTIWKELGPESAKIFLGQTQKVVNSWLLQRGFSIGICDNIPDEETKKDVKLVLDKAFLEVEKQITAFRNGSTQIEPGFTMQQSFEINVNKTLNDARKKAGDNANKRIDHRNSIKCTVDSGSKGNAINISQILACVGQQNVEGKRIPFGFVNRTLPHFAQYDEGHLSRGFVVHSYLAGLTPQEFFFHAMGGREGLSDTAVKTSETGYTQRRLMKSMEDMQCKYDGTVRDTTGTVLQFLYGEDSFDATYMEKYEPFLIGAADEDVEARYRFTTEELAQPGPATGITPEVADLIEGDPTTRAKLEQEYAALQNVRSFYRGVYTNPDDPSTSDQGDPNLMTEIAVPCNVRRCIAVVAARHGINSLSMPEGLTPTAIVDDVEALLAELEALLPSPSKEAKHNALTLFSCVIRELLAAKPVLCHHRLSRVAWRDVLSAVKERFVQAIVAPGESVGPLAAQSIGEPATQMTLNTFHYAGVSEKNVTLGVPRLKELIDVAKTIKTPLLTITLAEDKNDSEYAKEVLGSIEHTSVRDVVTTSAIYFDPYSEVPSKAGDVEPANAYYETHPDCEFALHHDNISPWVLCYKLNEPVLNLKKLTARDVVNKILEVAADNPPYVFSIKSRFGTYVYVRIVLSDDMKVSKDAWYSNEENEDDDDYINNNNNNDNDDSGGGSAYGHRRNEARTSISTEDGDDDDDGGGGGSGGEKATPWDRAEVAVLVKANTAILESKLSGIDGIDSASIKEVIKVRLVPKEGMHDTEKAGAFFKPSMDDKEKYSKESVRRILASGTNFAQLLTHPMVNFARTSSNDVLTVYDVLGIEGARSTLLYELRKVLSFDNSYVNDRHIGILADTMTQTGRLVAVSRHGINRSGTSGPLMRASFEETAAQFMQAAAFAETDYLKGISGNIMLGQLAPLGTGSICVVLDIDKLKDALAHDVVVAPAGGSGGGSGGGGGGSSNGSGDDYDYAAAAAAMSGMDRWDAINDPTKFSPTYFTSPTDAAGSFSPMGPLESSPAVGFLAASSPIYAPSSPNSAGADYSPSSPMYSNGMSSPRYGVSSPRYGGSSNSNSSSGGNAAGSGVSSPTYSPSSPNYSPSSPRYSPSSPRYSPSSPKYAVSSPKYSPSSPRYATTNGNGNNTVSSPKYSPGSPNVNGNNYYSPSSPGGDGAGYSPSSPAYGGSGSGSGGGGNYSPSSPSNF